MAEEEKNEEQENEQPDAEETPAEEEAQPADDPDAPGSEAEEASGSDVKPKAPPADDGEPEEVPGPKQIRKRKRSESKGPAKPQRSAEERASDRVERQRAAAVRRRQYRQGRRGKRGEPGTGTPPAERELAERKLRQGKVVSSKGEKTITVKIELVSRHSRYEKVVRRSRTLHAHDEANQANEGDIVRIVETRPLSRTKRWRLVDIVERAR